MQGRFFHAQETLIPTPLGWLMSKPVVSLMHIAECKKQQCCNPEGQIPGSTSLPVGGLYSSSVCSALRFSELGTEPQGGLAAPELGCLLVFVLWLYPQGL